MKTRHIQFWIFYIRGNSCWLEIDLGKNRAIQLFTNYNGLFHYLKGN